MVGKDTFRTTGARGLICSESRYFQRKSYNECSKCPPPSCVRRFVCRARAPVCRSRAFFRVCPSWPSCARTRILWLILWVEWERCRASQFFAPQRRGRSPPLKGGRYVPRELPRKPIVPEINVVWWILFLGNLFRNELTFIEINLLHR
jgi:hypothetical protein